MKSCSVQSLQIDEPLWGTAAEEIHRWILVEYRKVWPARFKIADLDLSNEQKERLVQGMAVAHSRLLLIRRPEKPVDASRIFLVTEQGVHHSTWNNPDFSLVDGAGMAFSTEPLVLVCTHGARDRCCGRFGGKIFAQLYKKQPDWVWQTSHLGGHRFSPTLLVLPQGLLYGRIGEEDCPPLITAIQENRRYLPDKIRGLSRWRRPVQAGAIKLWSMGIENLQLLNSKSEGSMWLLDFDTNQGSRRLRIQRRALESSICTSCSDTAPRQVSGFTVEIL